MLLLADLPAPAPQPPAARTADPGGLGRRPFTFVFDHAAGPGRATDEALRLLAPALVGGGCRLTARDEHRLELEYSYRPGWVALPIILVPIPGVLLLLLKQHDCVLVDVEEAPGGGIRVLVHGRAPRRIRRAFAALGR